MPSAAVETRTVCTITVNSEDEREAFRRHLPASRFRFVELVERGRPDWLASSCRRGVACDVLIVSAHFDGANQFFSDRLDAPEHLTVAELERVSCNGSCPTLFSRLKEVYLFGCNTLNPMPQSSVSAEATRNLVRERWSPLREPQPSWVTTVTVGESSRARMRQIFGSVPVIYGFSSGAPLGPIAGSMLEGYFNAGGARDIAQGRASKRLLERFGPSLAATRGVLLDDASSQGRRDMCVFADDRSSDVARLKAVRRLLQRPVAEISVQMDRVGRLIESLDDTARRTPAVAQALEDIALDIPARTRFLDAMRTVGAPEGRVGPIQIARDVGWLSEAQRRHELKLLLRELQARGRVGLAEVDLACRLNPAHELDDVPGSAATMATSDAVPVAAMRACLGSQSDRARVVQALVGAHIPDIQIATVYFRHRPLQASAEQRGVASGIAGMADPEGQVLALEALGPGPIADRQTLAALAEAFATEPPWPVQNAIARVLLRADRTALAEIPLATILRQSRRPGPAEGDLIDVLLGSLEGP